MSAPLSIWKGNEPKPEDAVESCEPVESPSVRRLGGAGRWPSLSRLTEPAVWLLFWEKESPVRGEGGATTKVCWARGEDAPVLNVCWPSGDTGGERMGLLEMGEGGTNGKDSRMESAVAEMADDPDTGRVGLSNPP